MAFAAVVGAGLVVGFNVHGWGVLVPIGVGVTCYGAAYAAVHDVYIHGRLRRPGAVGAAVRCARLAEAHRLHHRFGGEPYGMLVPIVPASLRARAAAVARPPLGGPSSRGVSRQRVAAVPGAGAAVGLEAGEQLLAVPALGAGAAHGVEVVGAAVGEGARVGGAAPEAERGLPTDRHLADADDGEQAGRAATSALTRRPAPMKAGQCRGPDGRPRQDGHRRPAR